MKIAIFGDWHGNRIWARTALRAAAEAGVTHYIHVGDHGAFWPKVDQLVTDPTHPEYSLDGYTRLNINLTEELGLQGIIVDGNHDNHTALRLLPKDENGFGVISQSLRYARRGTRLDIGGRCFGFLGGAFSIDIDYRTEGLSVWADQEQLTAADVEKLGSQPLDVLVSHDIPLGVEPVKHFSLPQRLNFLSSLTRRALSNAVENTSPEVLLAGHWHQRLTQQLGRTRVEVLDREFTMGNAVLLNTEDLSVEPLVCGRKPGL